MGTNNVKMHELREERIWRYLKIWIWHDCNGHFIILLVSKYFDYIFWLYFLPLLQLAVPPIYQLSLLRPVTFSCHRRRVDSNSSSRMNPKTVSIWSNMIGKKSVFFDFKKMAQWRDQSEQPQALYIGLMAHTVLDISTHLHIKKPKIWNADL